MRILTFLFSGSNICLSWIVTVIFLVDLMIVLPGSSVNSSTFGLKLCSKELLHEVQK